MTERKSAEQTLEEEGLPTERQRTPDEPVAGPSTVEIDSVEQADIESFPASDPPAWGSDPVPTQPPTVRP